MPTLLDIAPLIKTIEIRGMKLPVKGISAQGVVYLLNRFPILRKMLTQQGGIEGMTIESFMVMAPDCINATIACGFGYSGENLEEQERAEAVAASFSVDEQIHALTEIMELTFPRGVGPFVDMMAGLVSKAEELGKAVVTRSAVLSSGASRTGMSTRGNTPPVSSKDGSNSGSAGEPEKGMSSSQPQPQQPALTSNR